MIVKKVEKNIYNEKYLEARESVWNEKLKEYNEKMSKLKNEPAPPTEKQDEKTPPVQTVPDTEGH